MADEAYRFTMAWDDGDNLNSDEYLSIFKTLVDAGAHLDIATISGYTVLNCLPTQFSVMSQSMPISVLWKILSFLFLAIVLELFFGKEFPSINIGFHVTSRNSSLDTALKVS
jgi:hypothetical protein